MERLIPEENMFRVRLRLAMSCRGLNQRKLAACTGHWPARVSQHMRGRAKPKPDDIQAYSKALGVTPDWLLGQSDLRDCPFDLEADPFGRLVINNVGRLGRE